MNENSTPTQRKQARLRTSQVLSTPPGANDSGTTLSKNKMTPEQLWHKWETEAREEPLTPQLKWQLDMDHEMLEKEQKKNLTLNMPYTLMRYPRLRK